MKVSKKISSAFALVALLPICPTSVLAQSLLVNEIHVANIDQFIDPSYNYGGWVELYNPSPDEIRLNTISLRHTNSKSSVECYRLSQGHGSIPPRGYSVLWFDHHSKDGCYGPNAGTQIPFKLDADGGILELLRSDGKVMDMVAYPKCIARCSYMRERDGENRWGWTSASTPNASNNGSSMAIERLDAPVVSTTGGTFNDTYQFSVEIPFGTTLYYTMDGSVPIPNKSYKSKDGKFLGTETAIYRFMLVRDGFLNSPVITRSFIKNTVGYYLPVLSVNTAPANFYDDMIGLYVRGTNGVIGNNSGTKANQNMDWERPVNVEYFVPDADGQYVECLNQEASFSIFGGWTRFNPGDENWEYRTSFKLKSDKVFEGVNSFAYPLFGSKPYIKIKSFLVRNGGQDKYARIWDGAIQELLRTSGIYLDCQAWQPAHVFLDGKYLGMLNLREESNKQFAFSNYGIEKEEIDQWEDDFIIKEGDRKKLNEWYELSVKLAANPTDTDVWNRICNLVDIDEYCNYMAAEIYIGNLDWLRGSFKNLKGFRARTENGKFHLVLHDVDGGFGDTNMLLQVMRQGMGSLPKMFCNMLKYEPFKKQFIDAYCIMNGCVFNPERCYPIIMSMKNTISSALLLENTDVETKANLLYDRISDDVVRRPALRSTLKQAFNLKEEYSVRLSSTLPQAVLLLNGQEIPTGNFNGYLFPPVTLTTAGPEGYKFMGWNVNGKIVETDSVIKFSEGYNSGKYTIKAIYEPMEKVTVPPVCINEVSSANDIFINEYGKKSDWIELYNTTDKDFDLSGLYVSDHRRKPRKFQIQPVEEGLSTIIPAHGYRIIWCDGRSSLTELHTSFKLENADSAFVAISASDGSWSDSLFYLSQSRWHTYGRYPDGGTNLAMFDRPTINASNRLCTSTSIEIPDHHHNGIETPMQNKQKMEIASVTYYNLKGQRVSNPETELIVIQCVVYKDGTRQSRKIRLNPNRPLEQL